MSEHPWTPGPWNTTRGNKPYTWDIGKQNCDGIGKSWSEGNARLMATAPDLYDALDAIINESTTGPQSNFLRAIARGKAALAKARGEP